MYYQLIKRSKIKLFLVIVAVEALAVFLNSTRPPSYESVLNLSVEKINRADSDNYQYDEFYTLQAINFISDTVHSWFISPAIVNQLKIAPTVEIRDRKLASQNIEIIIKTNSQEEARKAADKVRDFLKTEIENLVLTPDGKPSFTVRFYSGLISQKFLPFPLVGAAGLIMAIAIDLVILDFLRRRNYDHNN